MTRTMLTQQQVDFYHDNGFLVVPDAVEPSVIIALQAAYDDLFASRGERYELGQAVTQVINPGARDPRLRLDLSDLATDLLGAAEFDIDHAILKAPGGAETPWHQDEAYWKPGTYVSLSIWIPLQDVDLRTGCMQFVPGSHKRGLLRHQRTNRHALWTAADVEHAVACPLTVGSVTVHHNRTLHYTGPNASDAPRRALVLMYRQPRQGAAA